jgi:hypothetical protein
MSTLLVPSFLRKKHIAQIQNPMISYQLWGMAQQSLIETQIKTVRENEGQNELLIVC